MGKRSMDWKNRVIHGEKSFISEALFGRATSFCSINRHSDKLEVSIRNKSFLVYHAIFGIYLY